MSKSKEKPKEAPAKPAKPSVLQLTDRVEPMNRQDAITTVLVRLRADKPVILVNLSSGEHAPADAAGELMFRTQEHEVLWVTEWAAVTECEACFALINLHRGEVYGPLWESGDWFLDPDDRTRLQALGAARDEAAGHELAQAERIIYLYDFRDRAARVLEYLREGINRYSSWKRRHAAFFAAISWGKTPEGQEWVARHNGDVSAAHDAWTDEKRRENDIVLDTWNRRIERVEVLAASAESERKALLALRRGER